ncbi:MAG: ABC transporter permease subunit [Micrococcales bacterium]
MSSEQSVISPESKKEHRRRARLARRLEGGTPSLRGTLIKIAALALVDAGSMFVALLFVAKHQWLYLSVLVVVTLLINWIYLRRGNLPAKYLAPGLLLLVAFQISIVFFSGFISFTNYGALHNGSKEEAATSIKLSAIVPDMDAPFLYVTLLEDSSKHVQFLATDINDPAKPQVFIGGEDYKTSAWRQLDIADPNLTYDDGSLNGAPIAIEYKGFKALSMDEILNRQAELSSMKVPVGPNIDTDGFMALDPSATGVQLTRYDAIYDAKTDAFTRVSDGKVFPANEKTGFFQAKDGERISETGWRVNIGWANFGKIFGDETLRAPLLKIFSWTIMFALASVLSTFVLGLALAFLFNDERIRGKKIYRSIMILPYAFPAFLSAYVWKGMFNTEAGFINRSILNLDKAHGIPWLTEEGPARWAVLLCNLWLGFPYMFLITTGALQAIPSELTESANIDGATPWQQFRLIKLPLLLISLAPLLIGSFAFNFNNFTIIYLITGGGPSGDPSLRVDAGGTDILISFVYKIAFSSAVGADYGLASAFSVLIFILVGSLSLLAFKRTQFLEDLA